MVHRIIAYNYMTAMAQVHQQNKTQLWLGTSAESAPPIEARNIGFPASSHIKSKLLKWKNATTQVCMLTKTLKTKLLVRQKLYQHQLEVEASSGFHRTPRPTLAEASKCLPRCMLPVGRQKLHQTLAVAFRNKDPLPSNGYPPDACEAIQFLTATFKPAVSTTATTLP